MNAFPPELLTERMQPLPLTSSVDNLDAEVVLSVMPFLYEVVVKRHGPDSCAHTPDPASKQTSTIKDALLNGVIISQPSQVRLNNFKIEGQACKLQILTGRN
jgi:hypothetical protein